MIDMNTVIIALYSGKGVFKVRDFIRIFIMSVCFLNKNKIGFMNEIILL